MKKDYKSLIELKKARFGEKFNDSDLNKDFVKYFENGKRVEVDFGYEKKRGTIGITTGWKPVFLLMLRSNSTGSSYTIGKDDKVIKVIN
jgi:hypothetical protein